MAKGVELGEVFIKAGMSTAAFKKGMEDVLKSARKGSRDLKKIGNELTRAISVPLAGAAALATKFSVDFNREISRVGTLIPGQTGRISDLKTAVQDLAIATGTSTKDISGGLFDVVSAFGDSADTVKNLELATRAAAAGFGTTSEAVAFLSGVTKAYGDTTFEAQQRVADYVQVTNRLGQLTVPELTSALGQTAAVAKLANVSQEELFATFAAGTGALGSAAEVGTKLKGALSSLLKPTKDLEGIYSDLNIKTGEQLIAQEGLLGAFQKVTQEAQRQGVPLSKLIGSVEGLGLVSFFATDGAEKFTQALIENGNAAGANDRAFEAAQNGVNAFGTQLARLGQVGVVALQRIGDLIAEVFTDDLTAIVNGIVAALDSLFAALSIIPKPLVEVALKFAALTALVGPVAIGFAALSLAMLNPVTAAVAGIGAAVTAIGVSVLALADPQIRRPVTQAFRLLQAAILNSFKETVNGVKFLLASLKSAIDSIPSQFFGLPGLGGLVKGAATGGLGGAVKALEGGIKNIDKAIVDALARGAPLIADAVKDPLKKGTEEGFAETIKRNIDEASAKIKEISAEIAKGAGETGKKITVEQARGAEEYGKILRDNAESATEKLVEGHQNAVEAWRNTFQNAITGVAFDLKDALQQVAVGFAAEIAASLFGSLGGGSSPQDFGGSIAQAILGGIKGGGSLIDGIGALFSSGAGSFSEALAIGRGEIAGPLTSAQTGALALNGAAGAYAVAGSLDAISKLGQSTEETTKAVAKLGSTAAGYGIGSALGSAGGPIGAAVGGFLGEYIGDFVADAFSGGPTNAETLARRKFSEALEGIFEEIGGLKFFGRDGGLQNVSDIVVGGSDRFNAGNARTPDSLFSEFGGQAVNAFVGVGSAIKDLLGITEDIGTQAGTILLEQFGGDIEALKAIVDSVGLTFESFTEGLIQQGKKGASSWLEIVSQIRDGSEAFQKGLSGIGEVDRAFDQLFKSQGRGQIALNQVVNLAIEAQEKEIQSVGGLLNELSNNGQAAASEIAILSDAIAQQGFQSLDQLVNATDLQLAQIVAAIDAGLQDAGLSWRQQTDAVNEYADAVNSLDGRTVRLNFDIRSNLDAATKTAIDAGIIAGADGSQLSSPSGTLRSPSAAIQNRQVNVNIDATGAGPGSEAAIADAVLAMEGRILDATQRMVSEERY